MAALIKHVLSNSKPCAALPLVIQCRNKYKHSIRSKKFWKNPIKPSKRIESVAIGLAARGFLRPLQDYTPPEDVEAKCENICECLLGSTANNATQISDAETRFSVLNECFKQFNHSVPNSILHTITTVGDLKNFYMTPITTTTPLDKMKTMDLPENLHVQYEPVRFHPETDTFFGGKSAYPETNILITGLRARKKYKSYINPNVYCRE